MQDHNQSPKEEFAMLGRGILRTFIRDVVAVVAGAVIGVVIGLALVFVIGLSVQFGMIGGGLVGAIIALSARSLMSPLFDYELPNRDEKS